MSDSYKSERWYTRLVSRVEQRCAKAGVSMELVNDIVNILISDDMRDPSNDEIDGAIARVGVKASDADSTLDAIMQEQTAMPPTLGGLYIIIGGTEVGKSLTLANIRHRLGADIVYCDEPDFRSTVQSDRLRRLLLNLTRSRVIVVDSLKNIVYGGGSLSKGGGR